MQLKSIRPTQFAAGWREVESKRQKLKSKSSGELKDYLKGHPVDGVVGPNGEFYAVDGHHFALAAQRLGIERVRIKILADFSDLSTEDFWAKIVKDHWAYLYRLGVGPLPYDQLPRRLEDLIDDPYRSLATAVQKTGAYKKGGERFSEFRWADFLRLHLKIEDGEKGFENAVIAGAALAKTKLARPLPGYASADQPPNCAEQLSDKASAD